MCVVKFWDMAALPAPITSTQKWQIIERQHTTNVFPQIWFSGLEVFRKQEIFEKNNIQGRPYVRKRSILLIASQLIEGAKNF